MAASDAHTSSQGHTGSAVGWLDAHYAMAQPEYEAMLKSVGIQPGWRVLDAGCGNGAFLPLLAELVGPSGHVTALDLAPENIEAVRERAAAGTLACPVEGQVGGISDLPFPDDTFDAVWCANTLQYLPSDEEVVGALREFGRVTKPGGLVASKEIDLGLLLFSPLDPHLFPRLLAAEGWSNLVRARGQRWWLEQAGLVDVWQRTTLIERWAPLTPPERAFLAESVGGFSFLGSRQDALPVQDRETWRALSDPAALLDRPDFYHCEGQVVAVGRVPGA